MTDDVTLDQILLLICYYHKVIQGTIMIEIYSIKNSYNT